MDTVGLGFFWNDLEVGYQFKTVGRTVTEADITNFVNCTGMTEVLFTNLDFIENRSSIGGRPAPGQRPSSLIRFLQRAEPIIADLDQGQVGRLQEEGHVDGWSTAPRL